MLKKVWIIFKAVMASLTVLTLILLFLGTLPEIVKWEIIQAYPYLLHIFLIVVVFWCVYLIKWIKVG